MRLAAAAVLAATLLAATLVSAADPNLDQVLKPVVLDSSGFDKGILETKMPWVVVFTNSEDSEEVQALAKSLDGLGRVGVVVKKKKALLTHMKLTAETAPAYRVYGFGEKTFEGVDYKTAEEAKAAMLATIPANLVSVVAQEADMQQVFIEALNKNTVPAMLFAEGTEIPLLLSKLAVWFADSYRMVLVSNPSASMKEQMRIDRLPAMLLMVPSPDSEGKVSFRSIPYDRTKLGAIKFANALRFLASAEMELRQGNMWPKRPDTADSSAPPPSRTNEPPGEIFEVTPSTPDACTASKLGLCIVAFLDGSPDNNDARAAQLEILKKVQHLPSNKGRALHFMWVDARCHPGLAKNFDVILENTPAVVAVSPKKSRFALMVGVFDTDRISTFIATVLSGKTPIAPYTSFPTPDSKEDCAAIYSAMPAPEAPADEFDLNDIMGEDVGPSEREASTPGSNEDAYLAAEAAAEKAEREERERRAREEVERLNKKSKKSAKGKKKSAKKAKTEL